MFISVLELFKIGIGPSSSHTMGPMVAAKAFVENIQKEVSEDHLHERLHLQCILKGSLAFTGKGHATDRAVVLGLHGYSPESVVEHQIEDLIEQNWGCKSLSIGDFESIDFSPEEDIVFDQSESLPQHPNGMIFQLHDPSGQVILSETFFSLGGGFISRLSEIDQPVTAPRIQPVVACRYGFDSASSMLQMCAESGLTIAAMKRKNELEQISDDVLKKGLDGIWQAMQGCVNKGLNSEGPLPGGLEISRRANGLYRQLQLSPDKANLIDWLCAYAMAACEENAAGHMVVTAPTNGAAGVIPAVLYYLVSHEQGTREQVHNFLLTASAIGGIIKHRSSISGAEVGCQGEVGSAASMAAAGLCAVRGGTNQQVENAAEIALEHHLGMTCDPVNGLVQVPCIERNGFGAIKAYTAASLALRGSGQHFMPLDSCIAAMKQTGLEMSEKYKETSLGGLAVSLSEC